MKKSFVVDCNRHLSQELVGRYVAAFFERSSLTLLEFKSDGDGSWRYGEAASGAELVIFIKYRKVELETATNLHISCHKEWPWLCALGKGLGEHLAVVCRGTLT